MSKKPITHVLLVTDMSGSMADVVDDVRGGFNTYLDGLEADAEAKYRVTSVTFSSTYMPICSSVKVRNVPRFDERTYTPGGMTALYDAIGRTIADFEVRVPQLGDGERVLLVVQTDGKENCSREYTREAVRKLIADREATGKRSCIYLGMGPNAWGQERQLGFAAGQSVHLAQDGATTRATYDSMTVATRSYARGARGDEVSKVIADGAGAASQ